MSQETENIKLFKYDKETDDFNTTTFNIEKCLNDNWEKIDSYCEDTTKDINTLKSDHVTQHNQIEELMLKTSFMTCKRYNKHSGYYKDIRWYRTDKTLYAHSQLTGETSSSGEFKPTTISVYFYNDSGTTVIKTNLMGIKRDPDSGDVIEIEVIR